MIRVSKLFFGIGLISSAMVFSSCAYNTRAPLTGFLYTSTQAGVSATPQVAPKMGEACATSILGLIATGDASIETARRSGGIMSIASVDEKQTGLLGIYATHCTIVRGK